MSLSFSSRISHYTCIVCIFLIMPKMQTPLVSKKPISEIPVPEIRTVAEYGKDVPAEYEIKRSYVRFHRLTEREWKKGVEYVADAEDEAWLENNVKFGGAAATATSTAARARTTKAAAAAETEKDEDDDNKADEPSKPPPPPPPPQLPLDTLEHMLDLLEKATGFDAIITLHQAEKLLLSKLPELLEMFPIAGRGVVTLKQVFHDVYTYWVSKRSKLKRPLLRQYWPVTSTDDTNPHLVFRPREKEKYKLRKKRQNDMEAFQKMKQLRNDFDNLRAVLDLVRRREEIYRTHVQLQIELFQQRLYDVVDTSGVPRVSQRLSKDDVKRVLDLPLHFDVTINGRKAKRVRPSDAEDAPASRSALALTNRSSIHAASMSDAATRKAVGSAAVAAARERLNVAGRNHGEPAPNFLHPLETRESYATSWDNAIPYVTAYSDSNALPTFRFRHRPRIGRGGRLCVDRLPQPPPPQHVAPITYFRAGQPLPPALQPQERLLDLLPDPLDHGALSRKIEALSAAAIKEDFDAKAMSIGADQDENDGDEVLVRLDDWVDTDEQLWGDERYAIGPI